MVPLATRPGSDLFRRPDSARRPGPVCKYIAVDVNARVVPALTNPLSRHVASLVKIRLLEAEDSITGPFLKIVLSFRWFDRGAPEQKRSDR